MLLIFTYNCPPHHWIGLGSIHKLCRLSTLLLKSIQLGLGLACNAGRPRPSLICFEEPQLGFIYWLLSKEYVPLCSTALDGSRPNLVGRRFTVFITGLGIAQEIQELGYITQILRAGKNGNLGRGLICRVA